MYVMYPMEGDPVSGEQNVEFQSGYEGFAGLAKGVGTEGDEDKANAAKLRGSSENVRGSGAGAFNASVSNGMMSNSNVVEATAGSAYDQSGRQAQFTTTSAQVEGTEVQAVNPVNSESQALSEDIRAITRA